MQIYNFVVLSVIPAPQKVPFLTLAKPMYLLFHLTYVNSNWTDDAQKSSQKK